MLMRVHGSVKFRFGRRSDMAYSQFGLVVIYSNSIQLYISLCVFELKALLD